MPETILVIEDDYGTRTCLSDFLEDQFIVITAADGARGLQLSREALPDLIICDIDMPYLNGYQVLEQLRADINTANIPFIFLSAHASQDKISLAAQMGADDYLIKPIKLTQLLAIIQSRLKKKQLILV
ncbi:MAG TPA: response regulator [Oscillatoriaceae cyanobacterium M33_DOE_052]|uniref:Response regulator n=1 Tax=Planktothricoides sp. SpSt-374 TaxID=2282167 RepID=A0A7C3VMF2_9CYAN|nr:response regulator [Oscillatoriaceae cyanobacterium M33_DOE_052]